jgi:predicted nucleic acid-binding protein
VGIGWRFGQPVFAPTGGGVHEPPAGAVEAPDELIVPTVSIYEVFERVLQQRGEGDALQAVAVMQQGTVVDLTTSIALEAARTGSVLGIPMADSIILATSRAFEATLWTQDSDFANIEGVEYVERGSEQQRD